MPLGDDSHRSRGAQGLPRTHTRGFDEERTRVLGLVFGILGAQRINGLESCHLWDQRDHTNDLAGSPLCECPSSKANLRPRAAVVSRSLICSILLLRNEMAPLRALADVQALQARLRGAGLDDTPLAPRSRAAGTKRTGRATIVPSKASLDAWAAGVASIVGWIRLSHIRRI